MTKKKSAKKTSKVILEYYAVKTLYRITAAGHPNSRKHYKKDSVMIEERVVLFKAKDFDDAIKKAEKEARRYCKFEWINLYNQKLVTEYLDNCEAYRLFERPTDGEEIYSQTNIFEKGVKSSEIINQRFGRQIDEKREKNLRLKFRLTS